MSSVVNICPQVGRVLYDRATQTRYLRETRLAAKKMRAITKCVLHPLLALSLLAST
jgi:hypothetical protein